jgi:ABC-type lipoprotein export system ATPase subunit
MVTHNPELAKKHAKTIYSIIDGKVEWVERKIKGQWKRLLSKKC